MCNYAETSKGYDSYNMTYEVFIQMSYCRK